MTEETEYFPNIPHSEFPEQQGGLMICGYEWSDDTKDRKDEQKAKENKTVEPQNKKIPCTYATKYLRYGRGRRYDSNIKKWLESWGHPIIENSPFDESFIQTNWTDGYGYKMKDYSRLYAPEQVANFIRHIEHFKPRLIMFMGAVQLGPALNHPTTLSQFEAIMGKTVSSFRFEQKPSEYRRFRVGFQNFERCKAVFLPHASGSRGLNPNYMSLFEPEMSALIAEYKATKKLD